jgi:hypothetical protein
MGLQMPYSTPHVSCFPISRGPLCKRIPRALQPKDRLWRACNIAAGDSIFFSYEQQDPQQIPRLRLASIMQGLPVSLAELQQQQQRAARRRLLAAASAPMSAPGPGPVPARSGNQQRQQSMVAMGPVPPQQALVS